MWGFVKEQVYTTPVRDLAELQERIYAAVNNVTAQVITHGSTLNTSRTFPVALMEDMLRLMELTVKQNKFAVFTPFNNWFHLYILISSEVIFIFFICIFDVLESVNISGHWRQ